MIFGSGDSTTAMRGLSVILGIGAVVMINSSEGGPMLREIERAIAREYRWPDSLTENKKPIKLAAEVLQSFVGEYSGDSGFKCAITREDDKLFLKFGIQPPLELYPESETEFFTTALNTDLTFDRIEDGEVKKLRLQQDNKTFLAERKP